MSEQSAAYTALKSMEALVNRLTEERKRMEKEIAELRLAIDMSIAAHNRSIEEAAALASKLNELLQGGKHGT